MIDKYIKYVADFKNLDEEDKKIEIRSNLKELFELIVKLNTNINEKNMVLPIYNELQTDNFYDEMFTYIISLKEEISKYIIQEYGAN